MNELKEEESFFRISCKVCQKEFCGKQKEGVASNLKRHMRTHTGDRPFPCPYCVAAFTTNQNLLRHCHAKHPGLLLPAFSSRPTTPSSAQLRDSDTANFPLQLTNRCKEATTDANAAAEMQVSGPSTAQEGHLAKCFKCPFCPKSVRYQTSLRYHIRQFHPERAGSPSSSTIVAQSGRGLEVECPHCLALLSNHSKLKRHLQKHCPLRFVSESRRRNRETGDHFGDDEDNDVLLIIGKKRSRVKEDESGNDDLVSLEEHPVTADGSRLLCPVPNCAAGLFASRRHLKAHINRCHSDSVFQ